jgi:pantetheine-phosphate adenylyltransferase
VVSEETRPNGLQVNELRRSRGLKPLRLHVVRMMKADDGKPISDTRIRQGEIDSRGGLVVKRPGPGFDRSISPSY